MGSARNRLSLSSQLIGCEAPESCGGKGCEIQAGAPGLGVPGPSVVVGDEDRIWCPQEPGPGRDGCAEGPSLRVSPSEDLSCSTFLALPVVSHVLSQPWLCPQPGQASSG